LNGCPIALEEVSGDECVGAGDVGGGIGFDLSLQDQRLAEHLGDVACVGFDVSGELPPRERATVLR